MTHLEGGTERMEYKHLFQHGLCIFCNKPIDLMCEAMPWRGGYVLPEESRNEHCPACEAWHKEAEKNSERELANEPTP